MLLNVIFMLIFNIMLILKVIEVLLNVDFILLISLSLDGDASKCYFYAYFPVDGDIVFQSAECTSKLLN